LKTLIIDGVPRQQAESNGRLTVTGDVHAVDDLLRALR
jgi:hypothetical protein